MPRSRPGLLRPRRAAAATEQNTDGDTKQGAEHETDEGGKQEVHGVSLSGATDSDSTRK